MSSRTPSEVPQRKTFVCQLCEGPFWPDVHQCKTHCRPCIKWMAALSRVGMLYTSGKPSVDTRPGNSDTAF